MAYSEKLNARSRMLQRTVTPTLDACENTFGSVVPPSTCTATGSIKCYKTISTCQDTPNFRPVDGKDYKFSLSKKPQPFPGEVFRPLLLKEPTYRATEIDPAKSLTKNARITYDFLNPDSDDIGIDPHVTERSTYPGNVGPYWDLLFARNIHYEGRKVVDKSGFQGLAENEYISRRYMIDQVKFNKDGTLRMVCKDLMKNADKVDVPLATDGLTTGVTTAGAGTIVMTDGTDMTQYDTAGYLFAGEEGTNIIQYTGKSGQTFTTCTWQKFGTSQADIDDETQVQQCFVEIATDVTDIMITILEDHVGFDSGDINSAEFASEQLQWLPAYQFTICWTKPVKASERLRSLNEQSSSNTWWDEETEKVRFKVFAPEPPGSSYTALTEAKNIKSIVSDYNEKSRVSRVIVYYNLIDNTLDINEPVSYSGGAGDISATSEGTDYYGTKAIKEIFAYGANSAIAASIASRYKRRFVDPPKKFKITVERKDADIDTAEIIALTHRRNINVDGTQKSGALFQVLKRQQKTEGSMEITVMDTRWTLRYGYMSPAGFPDYDSATDAQRQYGYMGNANNLVGSNGVDGYYMF